MIKRFFSVFVLFVVFSLLSVKGISAAAKLNFDPSSVSPKENEEFEVRVNIDTDGNSTFGADAIITYPSRGLELKSVSSGGFYTDFSHSSSDGRIEIHSYLSSLYDSKTGSGTLAKIVFKAKEGGGNDKTSFLCNPNGTESQILDSNGNNILSCDSLNTLSLNYTSVSSQTSTPTATATSKPTNSSKPTPTSKGSVKSPTPNEITTTIDATSSPTPVGNFYEAPKPRSTNLLFMVIGGFLALLIAIFTISKLVSRKKKVPQAPYSQPQPFTPYNQPPTNETQNPPAPPSSI